MYPDRSDLTLTNIKGTLADVKPGSIVEVKYMDNKSGSLMAEWIKVKLE